MDFNFLDFKIFKAIFGFISGNKTKALPPAEDTEIEIIKAENRDEIIIKESQEWLKKINYFVHLTKDLSCRVHFENVLETAREIHDRCVTDDEVPLIRLEEYHQHYTEQFITTFENVLYDLFPKPEVDSSMTSGFNLDLDYDGTDEMDSDLERLGLEEDYDFENKSIYEIIDELDPEKEEGFDTFSIGYSTYANKHFEFEKDSVIEFRTKYPEYADHPDIKYTLVFLGESLKDRKPIFEENIILNDSTTGEIIKTQTFVTKLTISNCGKELLMDISKFRNKNSLKDKLIKMTKNSKSHLLNE